MKELTEQQETFLILKWGKNYRHRLIEEWFNNNDTEFNEIERAVVFNAIRKLAEN